MVVEIGVVEVDLVGFEREFDQAHALEGNMSKCQGSRHARRLFLGGLRNLEVAQALGVARKAAIQRLGEFLAIIWILQ